MAKSEFLARLDAGEPLKVGRTGALSVIEVLAVRDWFDTRRRADDNKDREGKDSS